MTPGRVLLASLVSAIAFLAACGRAVEPDGLRPPDATPSAYVPTPLPAQFRQGTPPPEPVSSTAAIPAERLPVAEFVASGRIAGRLPVEVLPLGEFGVGLSGRTSLGERGMLFDYGSPGQEGPFWMKGTHIDLDIAFVDERLRIVSIRTMRAESIEYVYSAAPYRSAIEAPAGWYAAHGIREGDLVRYVPPGLPATP